tara:strand:+ start:4271 stop:4642 length:372 start_codon:yes stop_codon:yes gene_type:complete
MLKITRRNSFEAAHHLPLTPDGHKCKGVHGHSYECVVEICGEVDALGWIVDTANIDNAFASVHALVDHKVLNEVPGLENPTTERLVVWLWQRFNKTFGDLSNVHSIGVTVQESPRSTAFYDGP